MSLLARTMAGAFVAVLVATTSAWPQDKGTFRFAYLRLGWSATQIIRTARKMLAGLTDDAVDTILTQLRIARRHGTILQSDIGTAPDGARKLRDELFYIPR